MSVSIKSFLRSIDLLLKRQFFIASSTLLDFSLSKSSFKSDILIFKISSKTMCQSRNFLFLSSLPSIILSLFLSSSFSTSSTILHNLSAFPNPYTYHIKYFRYSCRFCGSSSSFICCAHPFLARNALNFVRESKYLKMQLACNIGSLKRLSALPFL